MLKKLTTLLMIFSLCVLTLQPGVARAGWTDDLVDKITNRVTNILNTINDAKATISDSKIAGMITEIQTLMQQAVDTQQDGLSEFEAGGCASGNVSSVCGKFRDDLKSLVQNMVDLNNEILDFHALPVLDLQMQDPGLKDALDLIPGRALFPAYKVLTKLRIFESGLLNTMQDAKANLALLKVVVFDDDGSSLEFKNVTADIEVPSSCVFVLENEAGVNGAGIGLISVGVVSRILGAIFEGFSKTIFAGPVEMDAGIHGYVHGTIHQNKLHVVGKLFTGLGEILMPVGVTATNKVKFCRIEQRQADVLLNQETILANQDDLLLGQWRTLCAFKHNLPDQCAEFVGNGFGNRGSKFENLH